MAKIYGLGGYISGKKGDTVFAPLTNGISVARAWRGTIGNPRTSAQLSQRSKISLTGKLSAIVPPEAILGLGNSKRDRRSRFNQLILNNTQGMPAASRIPSANIIFSEGALGAYSEIQVTRSNGTRRITLTVVASIDAATLERRPNGYGEEYVVLVINESTSQYDYCVTGLLKQPTAAGTQGNATTAININVANLGSEYSVYLYRIPMATDSQRLRLRYSYLGAVEGYVLVDDETGEVQQLYRGRSLFNGVVPTP